MVTPLNGMLQAKRIEADILGVVSSFSTALHSTATAFSAVATPEALGYVNASAALERDAVTAVDRLAVALRRLMFSVVLTSLDPESIM